MRSQMPAFPAAPVVVAAAAAVTAMAVGPAAAAPPLVADPFTPPPGKHVPVAAHGGRGGWGGPQWYKGWGGRGWGYGAGQGLYAGALVSATETAPYYDFTFGYPTPRRPYGYPYTKFPYGIGFPYYNISYGYYRPPAPAPH